MTRTKVTGEQKRETVKPKHAAPDTERGLRWWDLEGRKCARSAFAVAVAIANDQTSRRASHARFRRMYENRRNIFEAARQGSALRHVTYNVVRSCVNTVCAKISKNKPVPMFLTEDGDWLLQDKAEKLGRFVEGLFYELDFYKHAQIVFRDACIFDGGALRLYSEDGRIKCERALPLELLVDQEEAKYGEPEQLHHIRWMSRRKLLHLFPEYEDEILRAQTSPRDWADLAPAASSRSTDMIGVLESWHLASTPGADDGKHIIAVDGTCLVEEPYTKTYFPFLFLKWDEPITGFWGSGLAEELSGLQREINDVLRRIQVAMEHASGPKVFVPRSAKVPAEHLNNNPKISIVQYEGQIPPVCVNFTGYGPDAYQYLETLYRRAFEITGISQLSANSQKPAGLNSGVALETYQDIESERFVLLGQRYEDFFMRAAKMMVDMAKDMDGSFAVKTRANAFIESIPWKDVDMDEDEYDLKIFPVSSLPTSPSGKLQAITDLMKVADSEGKPLISGEMGMGLLGFPDLDRATAVRTAPLKIAQKMIAKMLHGGPYQTPEPQMNLALTLKIAQEEYLLARLNNAPEDRLENVRRFMDDLVQMLAPPPQAPPMGPAGPPTGPVMPSPTAPIPPPPPMAPRNF